jgi:hypothetical protein
MALLGAKILYLGEDDWVSIGEVWRYAGFFADGDPGQLELVLSTIESLTARGLIEPGEIRGSDFMPWTGSVARRISLVREACKPNPKFPWWWESACWLNNTAAGTTYEAHLPPATKSWLSPEEIEAATATLPHGDGLTA